MPPIFHFHQGVKFIKQNIFYDQGSLEKELLRKGGFASLDVLEGATFVCMGGLHKKELKECAL